MATIAPAPPEAPPTLTVGGVRRWPFVLVLVLSLVVLVSLIAGIAWLGNFAPLTVDNTAFGVSPSAAIHEQFDATAPNGDSFTQYNLALEKGEPLSFFFWIHNVGPLPVTLTDVSLPVAGVAGGEGVTLGRVAPGDGHPTGTLPYTIPARGYAQINVRGHFSFVGCFDEHTGTAFGSIPVTYELFGFVSRHAEIEMPMTISISGPPGSRCPAA